MIVLTLDMLHTFVCKMDLHLCQPDLVIKDVYISLLEMTKMF